MLTHALRHIYSMGLHVILILYLIAMIQVSTAKSLVIFIGPYNWYEKSKWINGTYNAL